MTSADTEALRALAPCPACGCATQHVSLPTCNKRTPYNPADRAFPMVKCLCGMEVWGEDWDDTGRTAAKNWNERALKCRAEREVADRIATLPAEAGSAGAVERYDMYVLDTSLGSFVESGTTPSGQWVRHSDYAALQSTLTRQQAENEGLRANWRCAMEELGECTRKRCAVTDERDALQQRLDLLSAEYATLADRSVEEQARAGELEADARRLDWLAREFQAHGVIKADRYSVGTEGCQLFTVSSQHVRGLGLRAAIDAALEGGRADG